MRGLLAMADRDTEKRNGKVSHGYPFDRLEIRAKKGGRSCRGWMEQDHWDRVQEQEEEPANVLPESKRTDYMDPTSLARETPAAVV